MISKSINEGRERNIDALFQETELFLHYHEQVGDYHNIMM